jgi:hypothetical protein
MQRERKSYKLLVLRLLVSTCHCCITDSTTTTSHLWHLKLIIEYVECKELSEWAVQAAEKAVFFFYLHSGGIRFDSLPSWGFSAISQSLHIKYVHTGHDHFTFNISCSYYHLIQHYINLTIDTASWNVPNIQQFDLSISLVYQWSCILVLWMYVVRI